MQNDFLSPVIDSLYAFVDPLVEAAANQNGAATLLKDLGYAPPAAVTLFDDFRTVIQSLLDVLKTIETSIEDNTDPDYVTLSKDAVTGIAGIIQLINDAGTLSNTHFLTDFV